jgi:hypothetical protein
MISNNDFALIAALDLESIKMKIMHKESGEGWSAERTNATETEYRRFLYLMKAYPHVEASPLEDVDIFWHYHILDTMKYARDCEQVFGYFLHHYPYLGLVGENGMDMLAQAGDRTRQLYESTFGVAYVRPERTDGALEAADVQTACGPAASKAANSAYCASPNGVGKAVNSAYCASPVGVSKAANSAYCASPVGMGKAGKSAYCASPVGVSTAANSSYCASPAGLGKALKSAYCASPVGAGQAGNSAYCASPAIVAKAANNAYCASPAIAQAA